MSNTVTNLFLLYFPGNDTTPNMLSRWIASFLLLLLYRMTINNSTLVLGAHITSGNSQQNLKISPKPCSVNGLDGTCMFVWECIKSEGQHVGMCMDSFMFGSCCSHNLTENYVLPQKTVTYHNILPTKPIGSNKNRPPTSNRPIISNGSSSSTILRPHGAGTLVIRPPGAHISHQSAYTSKPILNLATSTTEKFYQIDSDLTPAASISGGQYLSFNLLPFEYLN